MRSLLGIVSLFLTISLSISAEDRTTAIRNVLEQAHANFLDVAVDLPFNRLGSREPAVRERFRLAIQTLREAILELTAGDPRALNETKSALSQFRRLALLIPFHEIDLPDILIERWLAAEDQLFTALKMWEGSVVPPPTPEVWRYNRLAWKPLSGQLSLREAKERCAAIAVGQTSDWRVPLLTELAPVLRAMKDPVRNPVFGAQAAAFREVWTSEENPQAAGTFYFIDFQKVDQDPVTSGPLTAHQVVCVGKDNS